MEVPHSKTATRYDAEGIDSTLAFDTDGRFCDRDPRTLYAEGEHTAGKRSVCVDYVLEETPDGRILRVTRFYCRDVGRVADGSDVEYVLDGSGDRVTVAHSGQSLREFVENDFHTNPQAELGPAFDAVTSLPGLQTRPGRWCCPESDPEHSPHSGRGESSRPPLTPTVARRRLRTTAVGESTGSTGDDETS